jgi:hypothetical protein
MSAITPNPKISVITLKPRKGNPARFNHTIYQDDLEQLLLQRRMVREAVKSLEKMEEDIACALRSGALIEGGARNAALLRVNRKPFRVSAGFYFRLSVR